MSRYADMVWCQLRFPAELEAELAVAWLRSLAARGRAPTTGVRVADGSGRGELVGWTA